MKQKNNNVNPFNYPAKKYSSYVFDATTKYQKKYGFEMGTGSHATWNNEADAFKHTYMQAQLALFAGKHIAKFAGDYHEMQGNKDMGQSKGEENMDKWNNAQGREIAKEIIQEYGVWATAPSQKINDVIARKVMELHEKKNSYQRNCVKTINAKISRLQKLIEKSYIDKCEGVIDEEFWRIQNKKWRKEKNELMEQLSMLDVADEQFYMNCEQLLSFAKNAHEMFLKGSIEDKSFITKLVISKITYYNKKLDIELYPVFNSILKKKNKIATLEQAEMQTTSTKKAPEGANFKNGGTDASRFELLINRYYEHLNSKFVSKTSILIENLKCNDFLNG